MNEQMIDVARIDTQGRLRHARAERAAAMAESIAQHGQQSAIKVIAKGNAYRLVFGEHRLVAVRDHLKHNQIRAIVVAEDQFGDEADRQIEEIVENFVSFPLTVLEEAVALSTWKNLYEAKNNVAGRGGNRARKDAGEQTEKFSVCFSEAAAEQLNCTDRKIRHSIQIARGINETVRARIADHAIADHQGELQALATETEWRQKAIADILLAEQPQASTVAGAIAVLDELPTPEKRDAAERFTERFCGLKDNEQFKFFDLMEDRIDMWRAKRGQKRAA